MFLATEKSIIIGAQINQCYYQVEVFCFLSFKWNLSFLKVDAINNFAIPSFLTVYFP